MKRLMMCLFPILLGFSQNLLQNPSFESWTNGMPDYWYKDDSIIILQESNIVHSGNYSVKDSLITQNQLVADLWSDTIAVSPNIHYSFRIWVYEDDPAGKLRQAIAWHTSSGWTNFYSSLYSVDSSGWQHLTLDTLSPSGADLAYVLVRAYDVVPWDSGTVFYIDDTYFAPLATQVPVIIRIWHTPINPPQNTFEYVYAKVNDDGVIMADTLFYGINNLNSPLKLSHMSTSNDTFRFRVPGQTTGDTIFYYLKFTDDDGLSTISDTHAYYVGTKNIFINEVYYDAPGTDSGCYIEIYGSGTINLNGISLVGINGAGGSEYVTIDLNGHSIPSDGFFVVAQNPWVVNADTVTENADLQNGPDNLELRLNGITIDALGYGTLDGWVFTGEWLPVGDVINGHCLGRYPDGHDTDNNYLDFYDYSTLTPGQPNPQVAMTETRIFSGKIIRLKNPVISNINFGTIVKERHLYPIKIYNSLGEMIDTAFIPESRLNLPVGVYFLVFNSESSRTAKIVIIK